MKQTLMMAVGVEGVGFQRRLVVSRYDVIPFFGQLSSSYEVKAMSCRDSFMFHF